MRSTYQSAFAIAALTSSLALAQSAAYSPEIYSAGVTKGTVFPSLYDICVQPDSKFAGSIPYDTVVGNNYVFGKIEGEFKSCSPTNVTLEGIFIDFTVGKTSNMNQYCIGTIKIVQNTDAGTMKVQWKVTGAARNAKCSSSGQSFAITLRASTIAELQFPNLTSVEFDLISGEKNTFALVAENSIKLQSSRFPAESQIIGIAEGKSLQSTYCDRGGAEWPEAGFCFNVLPDGKTIGFLQSTSQPAKRGWAELKRSHFSMKLN